MIFDNEYTTRGTKRKKSHYVENGKEVKQIALRDISKSGFSNVWVLFNRESDLKAINQWNNIIHI